MPGAELHHAAGIHHGHSAGDLGNDGEIVRDEEHGQAEFGAELCEQIEYLGLDGDIERGGGLVGDEQLRAVDDGHGDHHALAHAAGELVGIVAGAAVGFGDGDIRHGLNGKAGGLALGMRAVSQYGLRDLVADPHDGIESGHRLLEDHGDARAAQLAHRVVGQRRETSGCTVLRKENLTGDPCLGRQQAHDGERSNGFAGAGFADQAEDFAGSDGEAEVADRGEEVCGDSRPRLSARPKGGSGEVDVQVADFEQRRHGVMVAASQGCRPAATAGQPGAAVPT